MSKCQFTRQILEKKLTLEEFVDFAKRYQLQNCC